MVLSSVPSANFLFHLFLTAHIGTRKDTLQCSVPGTECSIDLSHSRSPDDAISSFILIDNFENKDALRLYEMFMGPLEAVKPWQTNQLSGVVRFR